MKYCPSCEKELPRSAFAKDGSRYDGVQALCRLCRSAQYRLRKDKHRAAVKRWCERNWDKVLAYAAKWRNANRDYLRARDAKFAKDCPEVYCAKSAKRRAVSTKATPKWADMRKIKEIYTLAKERSRATGIKWHVDHIVPLQSPIVCGLHVEHNLQLLPAEENSRKHNRVWPDMP